MHHRALTRRRRGCQGGPHVRPQPRLLDMREEAGAALHGQQLQLPGLLW